jgi:hypothetical protein
MENSNYKTSAKFVIISLIGIIALIIFASFTKDDGVKKCDTKSGAIYKRSDGSYYQYFRAQDISIEISEGIANFRCGNK